MQLRLRWSPLVPTIAAVERQTRPLVPILGFRLQTSALLFALLLGTGCSAPPRHDSVAIPPTPVPALVLAAARSQTDACAFALPVGWTADISDEALIAMRLTPALGDWYDRLVGGMTGSGTPVLGFLCSPASGPEVARGLRSSMRTADLDGPIFVRLEGGVAPYDG